MRPRATGVPDGRNSPSSRPACEHRRVPSLRSRVHAAAGAFGVNLRSRGLRRAQLSFGAMWAGEWAATVAISVLAFREGGAGAVALVAAVRMLAAALLAPLAAGTADRHRREHVLVAVGAARGATLGAAAAVVAADGPIAAVYVLVALATAAQTLYRPAHSALLPTLCRTPDELTSANAVRGLLDSLATLAGPLAAAALIAAGGPGLALAACAATSLVSALLALRLPYEAHRGSADRGGRMGVRSAIAGLGLIARDPWLRLITGLGATQTFLRGGVSVLVVVVAIDLLGGRDADVGLLNAAIGGGAVAGSLLAAAVSWRGRLARTFAVGVALWGAPLAILGGIPEVAAALVLLAVVGVGNALVDVGVFTLLSRLTPDEVMARAFAAFEAILTLGVALGAAVTPLAIEAFGVRGALVALGFIGPAAALAAWSRLRTLDGHVAARDDDIALLQEVPMLRVLPEAMIEQLAAEAEREEHAPGTPVFAEGDRGSRFYVIAAGQAEVTQGGTLLRRLGRGDGFGEIALLRADLARTATVTAVGQQPLELLALQDARFLTAVTGYPTSSAIAEAVVAERLEPAAPRPSQTI